MREFAAESIYHVYNRGVERRMIFMDVQDYYVFLNRLRQLLDDPETLKADMPDRKERLKSFYGEVELLAFCLMPNHFHLLIYQHTENAIAEFMRALSTSYTMYFNKRYERVGSLFQGRYKARLVDSEPYWQHISRYIHLNPEALGRDCTQYEYSSLHLYSTPNIGWLRPEKVLAEYKSLEEYLTFVNDASGHLDSLHQEYSLE